MSYIFRPPGDTDFANHGQGGVLECFLDSGQSVMIMCETGSNGYVEWISDQSATYTTSVWVVGYIK